MRLSLILFLISCLLTVPAAAEDPSGSGAPPLVIVEQGTIPSEEPPPTRSGLYARVGLGGGAMYDDYSGPFGWGEGHARGGSGAFELMIGGTLGRGLILGGGLQVEWVQSPTIDGATTDNVAIGALTMVGAFIAWYPSAEPEGFYLTGFAGGARMTIEDASGDLSSHAPVGGVLSAGVGYEWLVGERIGLGGLLRATGGTLGDDGMTHNVAALSIMAALSWY